VKRDKPDSNAKEIIASLESRGWRVVRVSSAIQQASGVPDCFVARYGQWHAVELKRLGGHLRSSQIEFAVGLKNRGCYHVGSSSFEIEAGLESCYARLQEQLLARSTSSAPVGPGSR
jgi:hypothetical protein